VTERLANDLLGAVALRRVDQVHAPVERGANQPDRCRLVIAGLTEPAVTAATEPHHARGQARSSQYDSIHARLP
jgi:hypothetical protein